jgi:hypothetical protein
LHAVRGAGANRRRMKRSHHATAISKQGNEKQRSHPDTFE